MQERSNLDRCLYKIVLFSVKVLPMIISGIYLMNTTLSYFNIDWEILSYIVAGLFIAGLYLLSIAFKFCRWHRVFIHYITGNLILNTLDCYVGIPVSDKGIFLLYLIFTGICLFLALYLRKRDARLFKKDCCKDAQGYCRQD